MNLTRRRWVLWLLVVGIPAVLALWATTEAPIMQRAYPAAALVLALALLGLVTDRISVDAAVLVLLVVAVAMMGAGFVRLLQTEPTRAEAGYFIFRAVVLTAGVTFMALGPSYGLLLSVFYVAASIPVQVQLGMGWVGSGDLSLGIVQNVALMIAVVAILRALTATLERLEASAQQASGHAELAFRDDLTGLANRRQLSAALKDALSRATQGTEPDALVLFDLDHFKQVNDTLGHDVGDEVLQRTAAIAAAAMRDDDQVGRWGGEEFLAILQRADIDEAVAVAERIRRALQTIEGPEAVTASFGVTRIVAGDSVTEAIRRADQALYEAKQGGRNRVVRRTSALGPGRRVDGEPGNRPR